MTADTLFIPEWVTPQTKYTLSDAIPAFQVTAADNGGMRLGRVSKLPQGAELEACGSGFNVRTIQVRCNGRLYFVYLQDLDAHCRVPVAVTDEN